MLSNKILKGLSTLLLLLFLMPGCDMIDPTEVENPDITEEKLFEDATGGAEPLIVGLEFAYSEAIGKIAIYTECVSDNYMNTSVFLSSLNDSPREITPTETVLDDDREIYFRTQTLLALADFGLNTVLPKDAEATDIDKATVTFYRGMALLLLAENFTAFPVTEGGTMVPAADALNLAIDALNTAYNLNPVDENALNCKLALARAYRLKGDKTSAETAANDALALSTDYVFYAQFDAIELENEINIFAVIRGQNDLQPLPRLDFIDPKYVNMDDPAATLKMEETHLILAEVHLVNGNLAGAQTEMKNAVALANSRMLVQFADPDTRTGRPDASDLLVKADAQAEPLAGLILERNGSTVEVSNVSATSVTDAQIDALADENSAFRLLYLLRQEIFFAEGRRMSDLGIRLPVMQQQIEANPNVSAGMEGTSVVVPSYIPQGREMDSFSVDTTGNVVTIQHDMNQIIADNISSVSPLK